MSDIETLRTHLFETLAGLKNKTIDIEHAKAINETAQSLINCAKVEVDFMKASGQTINSGFIALGPAALPAPGKHDSSTPTGHGLKVVEHVAGGTVTTHRMR